MIAPNLTDQAEAVVKELLPDALATALEVTAVRLRSRIDAAAERGSETIGIGPSFAREIENECRRAADLIASMKAEIDRLRAKRERE